MTPQKTRKSIELKPGRCPACGGPLHSEPGSFAFINGGALRKIDEKNASPAEDLIGFLSMGFHGSDEEGGLSPSALLSLADNAHMGQFELKFCSTQCMRQFFNDCVDALESAG